VDGHHARPKHDDTDLSHRVGYRTETQAPNGSFPTGRSKVPTCRLVISPGLYAIVDDDGAPVPAASPELVIKSNYYCSATGKTGNSSLGPRRTMKVVASFRQAISSWSIHAD
jgi:hypothetical protein